MTAGTQSLRQLHSGRAQWQIDELKIQAEGKILAEVSGNAAAAENAAAFHESLGRGAGQVGSGIHVVGPILVLLLLCSAASIFVIGGFLRGRGGLRCRSLTGGRRLLGSRLGFGGVGVILFCSAPAGVARGWG